MRRLALRLTLVAALVALALAPLGCTKKLLPPPNGNQPPQTTVFIQMPDTTLPATVNHIVHLYWYGTDADGYVRSYRVRLVNPADTVAADSAWRTTTSTDEVLTIWTPDGYTTAYFEVAAVDDHGAVDPTPAVQRFQFSNHPPVVTLTMKPQHLDRSDTTYASVTVAWSVSDPDGDASKVVSHIWLDRMAGPPLLASGGQLTVPSEKFKINGAYVSDRRTLYIQGVDDGGMAGPIDSVTWYVRQPAADPRARVLFIDEQPLADAASLRARNDSIYINAAARVGVPASQRSYIWLSATQPFKSDLDLYQTCKLFESVVWFRGNQNSPYFSNVLLNYRKGLGRYLAEGGKVYLETQNMAAGLSTQGALDASFLGTYMDCDGVFQYGSPPDSSANYAVNNGWKLYTSAFGADPATGDSIASRAIVGNMRAFRVRNASDVYIYAKAGGLSPAIPMLPMPVAINVKVGTSGRIVACTFPIIAGDRFAAFATNIMRQLGLDQP